MSSRGNVPAKLRPVPLPELRLLPEGREWAVEQPIDGLESVTPVRGHIRAIHRATVLEVEAEAETSLRLCCDRCLQPYEHTLRAAVEERIELLGAQAPLAAATDAAPQAASGEGDWLEGPLDDRLDGRGLFDPERWLFEQLSLRLPLVNRCGADCPGPPRWSSGDSAQAEPHDPRWAALRSLRQP